MISTTLALFIMTALFMLGFMLGWGAGKMRLRDLLSSMAKLMEQLRADSKVKVMRRDIAKHYADNERADELTKELAGESVIFYEVRGAIRDWCQNNNEKDPFAL
jgi:hypothetical protein